MPVAGLYALRVEARGFQARTVSLPVANRQVAPLTIVFGVAPVVSQATVTAARAAVEEAGERRSIDERAQRAACRLCPSETLRVD